MRIIFALSLVFLCFGCINQEEIGQKDHDKIMNVLQFQQDAWNENDILSLKKLSGEYYHMVGKYTLTRKEDTPSGHFSLLWQKIDGEWKIIADQTCG